MLLRNNKVLTYKEASMESDKAEVRVDGQEQTSVVEQNQRETTESDRQRNIDLRSDELGTAGTIDMMQIGLMIREMHTSMKEMENRLKDNIKEEFESTRVENQRNLERLEYNILGPEGRLMEDMSPVDQISCSEQELENRMSPLEQECVKNIYIKDEKTHKSIVEDNQISIEKSQNEYFNKNQTNAGESRRESAEVTENIIVINRVIIEEGKQICVEETQNSENQMNSASNQITEIFVNIEQVFRPQTNRNDNIVNSVSSGEIVEQVKGLSATVSDVKLFTDNDRWNVVNKIWNLKTSKFKWSKISATVVIQIQGFTSKYFKKKDII